MESPVPVSGTGAGTGTGTGTAMAAAADPSIEEDSYIVSNFNSICRLCLGRDGVMSHIFEHTAATPDDLPLFAKIHEFIEVQILPNDGLPARICHRCLYKTEKFVKFRTRCYASDTKLRRLTRKLPRPPPSTVHADQAVVYQNGDQTEYKMEESVVTVVDPSLDYDTSDQSDREQPEVEQHSDVESAEVDSDTFTKKVFMCQYCDKAFTENESCLEHERKDHDPKAPFGCEACGLIFAERAGQAAHARSVHNNTRPYTCSQCDKSFGRRSDLRKHSVVHTGVRPYQCHFCLKSFSRNTNLSKHLRIHSGQKPHVCPQCPMSFISKGDLSRHIMVHSGAKPYTCSMCPLSFGRRDKLLKHEARHQRINETESTKDSEYDKEENIVVSVDPFKSMSDEINTDLFNPGDLNYDPYNDNRSIMTMNMPESVNKNQLYRIPEKSTVDFNQHSTRAMMDMPRVPDHIFQNTSIPDNNVDIPRVPEHISGEGGFSYHNIKDEGNSLDQEMDSDGGNESEEENNEMLSSVKNIECQQCPKKFSSMIAFNKHLAVHDGIKSFQCIICNKIFMRRCDLDRHANVHTGFRPYECTRCDKKFGRKDKLVRHERIHDDKKEFDCGQCSATFTRKDSLSTHYKTHIKENNMSGLAGVGLLDDDLDYHDD